MFDIIYVLCNMLYLFDINKIMMSKKYLLDSLFVKGHNLRCQNCHEKLGQCDFSI